MPKCRIVEEEPKPRVVKMSDMKPLQIGRIVGSSWDGYLVWRTASEIRSEVVNLSNYRLGSGWTGSPLPDFEVRLLAPGEEVTLVLSND